MSYHASRRHVSRSAEMASVLRSVAGRLHGCEHVDRIWLAGFLDGAARFVESGLTKRPLTPTQAAQLAFLEDYIKAHGYAPTFEEIAQHFGYQSLGTVHEAMKNLEFRGYIRRLYNVNRGIILVGNGLPSLEPDAKMEAVPA